MKSTAVDEQDQQGDQPGSGLSEVNEVAAVAGHSGEELWPKGDAPQSSSAVHGRIIVDGPATSEEGSTRGPQAQASSIEEAAEIPYHEWESFFNELSDRNEGKVVRVEIGTAEPGWPIDSVTRRLADGLPLVGLVADFKEDAPGSIEIILGTGLEAQITHTVTEPTHVWFAQADGEEDSLVQIESANGPSTIIRF